MNKEKIMNRLNSDYNYLNSLNYTVVGVFLQGSQNYELDYEGSDIDTYAVVLPTFGDFVLNKSPVSQTIVLENNEHINVKDIREMNKCLLKQNPSFLELLFTKYYVINPLYKEEVEKVLEVREAIAHYDKVRAVKCMIGTAMTKNKDLCKLRPSVEEKVLKYGYDSKQLHHILRMENLLKRYIAEEPFEDCLIPTNKEYLLNVKVKYIYDLKDASQHSMDALKRMEKMATEFIDKHNDDAIDTSINELLKRVTTSIIADSFKNELCKDKMSLNRLTLGSYYSDIYYSVDDKLLYGQIFSTTDSEINRDLVNFECDDIEILEDTMIRAIADYNDMRDSLKEKEEHNE